MERIERIRKDRSIIRRRAFERWKGFQPRQEAIKSAVANNDGSVPVPQVGASTPEQRARFESRERKRLIFDNPAYRDIRRMAERQIGATLDFADLPPNDQALKAGRPVARIVTLGGPGMLPQGFATGFLVGPDLLATNHHVFRAPDEAEGVGAQFLHERASGGIREGVIFELLPQKFFVNHPGLDYAIVAVSPKAKNGALLSQFQHLPLIAAKGKIIKGDPVNIIQHPEGRPKQYVTVNNRLLDIRDDGFLLYEADTLEGSSGSPVFNQHWETIALHHCGVPLIEEGKLVTRDGRRLPLDAEVSDGDLIWVANEGIRISAIVASLADKRLDEPEQRAILKRLIDSTLDPLRLVDEGSPMALSAGGLDALNSKGEDSIMAQNIFNFTGPVTIHLGATHPLAQSIKADGLNGATAEPEPTPPAAEARLKFDEDYKNRKSKGYNPGFLPGWKVDAPSWEGTAATGKALEGDNNKPWVIPYYHYSLAMNVKRRLLAWAASNVDYSAAARKHTKTRKQYGSDTWRLDPRVAMAAPGLQIEDAHFYGPATKIDRGHIVRREDSAWGSTAKEAEFGNSDTFHWTNCTPQSFAFNQAGEEGIWGRFEEHIQREVKAAGGKMSVFAGPVFSRDDPWHGYDGQKTIQAPMQFWKIVACVVQEGSKQKKLAYGFVFDQTEPIRLNGFERLGMDDYKIHQKPVTEIAKLTGITFDKSLASADVLARDGANESLRRDEGGVRIFTLEDLVLG